MIEQRLSLNEYNSKELQASIDPFQSSRPQVVDTSYLNDREKMLLSDIDHSRLRDVARSKVKQDNTYNLDKVCPIVLAKSSYDEIAQSQIISTKKTTIKGLEEVKLTKKRLSESQISNKKVEPTTAYTCTLI